MSISSLLAFVLLPSFSILAQNISDEELSISPWHVTNLSIDSNTILNQDTLILRQALRSGDKYDYDSTTISRYDTWNIHFGKKNDLTIYSIKRPETGIIRDRRKYYAEMFPCINTVWFRKRKVIGMKIGHQFLVKYKISHFSNHELILVKIPELRKM